MINRSAVLVTPKAPYIEWASSLNDSGMDPSELTERTVYLLPDIEMQSDPDTVLREFYDLIFDSELEGWHTDPTIWPPNRTYEMFREWFEVEFNSIVIDLVDDPIIEE